MYSSCLLYNSVSEIFVDVKLAFDRVGIARIALTECKKLHFITDILKITYFFCYRDSQKSITLFIPSSENLNLITKLSTNAFFAILYSSLGLM